MKTVVRTLALAVTLLLLTVIPTWASQDVGGSPYTADLLVSGLNTGRLNPGQEYWYAYSRLDLGDMTYDSIILNLNFEAEGRSIASRVNFQVFTFEQVEAWLEDNSGPIASLGLGTPASADFDINTGERLWAGPITVDEVYYVRIFNLSPSPVRFRLTALGQRSGQVDISARLTEPGAAGQAEAIPAAMNTVPETTVPAQPVTLAENAPASAPLAAPAALPVQPANPAPVSTNWLLAAQAINGLSPQEAAAWLMSAATLGWLPLSNPSPSLAPFNPNADAPVGPGEDDQGSSETTTAEVTAAPLDPYQGYTIYPNRPLKLLEGPNTGRLGPKAEHWYTFTPGKVDNKRFEIMSLTMFFTPGEPNVGRYVIFELFTGSQYQIWERGTPDDMEHFGAGSWVSRDGDYNTGERLWHGVVVDGDQYFVKVTNGTNEWIDYHLITGDVINTELGPVIKQDKPTLPLVTSPTGKDIGSPLAISLGHRPGQLAAGEDVWFSFENKNNDPDEFEFRNYFIQLSHIPGAGYVTNHVNVEIYPFQAQHLWRRGDPDLLDPLGAGSDATYNRSTDTHTWIWDGHLVSNTIYFIRVRNGSSEDIAYDLLIQRR